MDLSLSTLVAGLVVSGAGFVLFSYGKRLQRAPQFVAGLALMAVPFVGGGALVVLAVGGGVMGALWIGVRLGM
jgi:hypothetical protein